MYRITLVRYRERQCLTGSVVVELESLRITYEVNDIPSRFNI